MIRELLILMALFVSVVTLFLRGVEFIKSINDESAKQIEALMTKPTEPEESPFLEVKRPKSGVVAVNGAVVVKEKVEVKNPFTYRHESRNIVAKPLTSAENLGVSLAASRVEPSKKVTNREKPAQKWELCGVIISENFKNAIVSRGEETLTLGVGGVFGENFVTAIEESSVSYAGKNGAGKLSLSLP